jgi:hypothetical protein
MQEQMGEPAQSQYQSTKSTTCVPAGATQNEEIAEALEMAGEGKARAEVYSDPVTGGMAIRYKTPSPTDSTSAITWCPLVILGNFQTLIITGHCSSFLNDVH